MPRDAQNRPQKVKHAAEGYNKWLRRSVLVDIVLVEQNRLEVVDVAVELIGKLAFAGEGSARTDWRKRKQRHVHALVKPIGKCSCLALLGNSGRQEAIHGVHHQAVRQIGLDGENNLGHGRTERTHILGRQYRRWCCGDHSGIAQQLAARTIDSRMHHQHAARGVVRCLIMNPAWAVRHRHDMSALVRLSASVKR